MAVLLEGFSIICIYPKGEAERGICNPKLTEKIQQQVVFYIDFCSIELGLKELP